MRDRRQLMRWTVPISRAMSIP